MWLYFLSILGMGASVTAAVVASPLGVTDPDAATLIPFGDPSLFCTDPDAAELIAP